jgi:N6-L-threonylcarbamoyladenine synthase
MVRLLGIETSCDETSAAVVEAADDAVAVRSLVILSQDVHEVFGGVVPEIAARAHLTTIVPVVASALEQAALTVGDLDAIAVTYTPGLVGALLVGVSYAKALAFAAGRPVVPVHHMEGHLFATSLEHADAVPPFTALLVSGGHTMLLDVAAWGEYRLLGATRDDAAGEAFDKVAKMLGLPYPGGRHVEALAATGDPKRHRFTRPMLRANQRPGDADYFDLSFSGIKTAVLQAVAQANDGPAGTPADVVAGDALSGNAIPAHGAVTAGRHDAAARRADIARGFQDAVVETLVEKTARAARAHRRTRIVLGGGVACNQALTTAMRHRAASLGATVYAPSLRLATDNAAMIARAGLFRLSRGDVASLGLNAYASRPLPGTSY